MKTKTLFLILAAGLALCVPSHAVDPPGILNHQGRIAVNGVNHDGDGYFKFALVGSRTNLNQTATAVATIEAEVVTSVAVVNGGSGYVTAPAVSFQEGEGSGATAVATIAGGMVTSITVTDGGNGYDEAPFVVIEEPPENWYSETFWSHDGTSSGGSEPIFPVPVHVAKGHYSVLMGDPSFESMELEIPSSVFENHADVYLRLWFATNWDGPFELLVPDRRIAPTGYAMSAGQAMAVAPGGVTSEMLAEGAVTGAKLAAGAVSADKIGGGTDGQILYREAGGTVWTNPYEVLDFDDADADPTNELQDWGSLPGIPAGFTDGTDDTIDADSDPQNELQDWGNLPGIPAAFADGTDDTDDADADPTNELQTVNFDPVSGQVSLSGDPGGGFNNNDADSDPQNELQTWDNLPGIPAAFADGTDDTDDADADPTNELQTVNFDPVSGQVSLSGDPGGGFNNNDADSDPQNELQTWDNLPGIPAEFADGTDDTDDADADPANELQTLSFDPLTGQVNLSEDPGMGFNINDEDSDPGNELQDLVLTGETLSISGGSGSVDLAEYLRCDGSNPATDSLDLDYHGINNVGHLDVWSLGNDTTETSNIIVQSGLEMNDNRISNVLKMGIGTFTYHSNNCRLNIRTSEPSPCAYLHQETAEGPEQLHTMVSLALDSGQAAGEGFGGALEFLVSDTANPSPVAIGRIGGMRSAISSPVSGGLAFETLSGSLETRMTLEHDGELRLNGDLSLGRESDGDDDTIYFDDGATEHLQWQDGLDQFHFSNDVVATSFSPSSDRNLKEDITPVDPADVLERLEAVPVSTWNFRVDDDSLRHIGPMAQDFHAAFGVGADDRHISTTDADGVAFAAIQALKRLLDEKERRIAELEERIERLERATSRGRR